MRTFILAAILALGVTACATTEDVVPIPYAASSAAPVAGAEQISVTVVGADARTTNRGRISTKVNGYGMEMAAIRSQEEVADVVESALGAELKKRGYRLGAGGPQVNAAVNTFYSSFKTGMFAGKATGDVQLTIALTGRDGAELYRRVVSGSVDKTVGMASGKNAADTLSQALAQALGELFADPAFTAALAR